MAPRSEVVQLTFLRARLAPCFSSASYCDPLPEAAAPSLYVSLEAARGGIWRLGEEQEERERRPRSVSCEQEALHRFLSKLNGGNGCYVQETRKRYKEEGYDTLQLEIRTS